MAWALPITAFAVAHSGDSPGIRNRLSLLAARDQIQAVGAAER